jgi:hypothetical protein
MDDIAKRGKLSFGCRGIPSYKKRTNQPNEWFLMDDIATRSKVLDAEEYQHTGSGPTNPTNGI